MTTSTEIVAVSDVVPTTTIERTVGNLNAVHGVRGNSAFFSTIQGDDLETRLTVLSAMDNSVPLSENLNKTLQVENIIVSTTEMPDDDGVLHTVPRAVLIDVDGNAFHAMSGPVLRSIENVFGIVGPQHTWGRPIPLKTVQEGTGTRKYFVLKVDLPALMAADKAAAKGK